MIQREKLKILTPLQKLPNNVGDFGQNNCCHRLKKVAQSAKNRPIWSHQSLPTFFRFQKELTPSAQIEEHLVLWAPGIGHGGHVVQNDAFNEHPEEHGRLAVFDQRVEGLAEKGLKKFKKST